MDHDALFDGSKAHLMQPTPGDVAAFLRNFNAWRRGWPKPDGDDIEMPEPAEIGVAIDQAIALIEARCNLTADFTSEVNGQ